MIALRGTHVARRRKGYLWKDRMIAVHE